MQQAPHYPSEYVHCHCRIIERFAPTAFHAELPNGKVTVAFIQKREEHLRDILQAGDTVLVRLTTADFDRARILEHIVK